MEALLRARLCLRAEAELRIGGDVAACGGGVGVLRLLNNARPEVEDLAAGVCEASIAASSACIFASIFSLHQTPSVDWQRVCQRADHAWVCR